MENNEYLFWIYSFYFIFITTFTVIINSILLKFSRTLGIREQEQTIIRWSPVSKPALGGITFFLAFLITLASYSIFFHNDFNFHNKSFLGMIAAATIAFMMGLADDAYNTKPVLKFTVQLLCGVIMIASGNYIQTTPYELLNFALTIIWVVGIMNSVNMLDNMDAITTSVSAAIIVMFLACISINGDIQNLDFLILIGILSGLIGFLFHNWHPSKMFMGDTGSQFLGVILAFYGIKYLWNASDYFGEVIQAKQICLVLIAFSLPLIDTSIVFINRIGRKSSPFIGGKDHTTHHLSYLGLSDSQVAFIYIGLSIISLFCVIVIQRIIDGWSHLLTFIFWSWFFVVFSSLFYITRTTKKDGSGEQKKNNS